MGDVSGRTSRRFRGTKFGRFGRVWRLGFRRIVRRVALSQMFLVVAVIVVALAMVTMGGWIGNYLKTSIGRGVATTAAASIDALISHNLRDLNFDNPLSDAERATLDEVFRISSDADSTRLLQIRIRNLQRDTVYESFGGIISADDSADFAAAASGEVISRIVDLPLQVVGPLPVGTVAVLELHTPLHDTSESVFAVADLYYSARSILAIQSRAQQDVWVVVALTGIGVIGVLYVLVARASRTIVTQRSNLARNLDASRRLSEENAALHAESERLRIDSNLSHERLLAQVGSELHDGPIQLMTLIVLRLSKAVDDGALAPALRENLRRSAQLASDAMGELRNISSGLILPELADLALGDAIELAISRHEGATGTLVGRSLAGLPDEVPMVTKICAYRVVQEALNNAYWHGAASAPSVAASYEIGTLRLAVSNAARRREVSSESMGTRSLGLKGMRFRIESLGGALRFSNEPGEITRIEADIPLRAPGAQRTDSNLSSATKS